MLHSRKYDSQNEHNLEAGLIQSHALRQGMHESPLSLVLEQTRGPTNAVFVIAGTRIVFYVQRRPQSEEEREIMKCTPLTLRAASARTAANYMYHDRDHEHDHAYEENPLVRAPRGRACEARNC